MPNIDKKIEIPSWDHLLEYFKKEWDSNKIKKDSGLEDSLTGNNFNLYYDAYHMEWTPLENRAFEGYIITKLKEK
jgi:hypothetical protein